MKILFISALLPYPLYSGGQVRVYNLLKELSKHHEITLLTFLRNDAEREYFNQLPFCHDIDAVFRGHAWRPKYLLHSLFSDLPLLLATYAHKEMQQLIRKHLSSHTFDVVHIEPSYVWSSLPDVSVPIVVGEHNIEYLGYQEYTKSFFIPFLKPFLTYDVSKLRRWEETIWKKAAHVITVSDEDAKIIQKAVPDQNITVVPNGVDIKEFKYLRVKQFTEPFTLLFVGNFLWLQNRDAVRFLIHDIWPKIRERFPQTTLKIVGRGANMEFSSFIKRSGAVLLDGVEDIYTEYAQADILLAPIRIGSGTRYKILEAMASGLPIVTTSIGASGLQTTSGRELFIADTPDDFLKHTETILNDSKTRDSLRSQARKKIEQSYSWDRIAKKLESVWRSATAK